MFFVGFVDDMITGEGIPLCNAPNKEKTSTHRAWASLHNQVEQLQHQNV